MSYCRKEGKDQIIFVTKDDHEKHSVSNPLLPDDEEPVGLIKENGEINWDCPCLQGMADGPCGEPFKDAFSCFHYSEVEPKGVDCLEQFKSMQDCFLSYPEIYGSLDDDIKESETKDDKDLPEVTRSDTVESPVNSVKVVEEIKNEVEESVTDLIDVPKTVEETPIGVEIVSETPVDVEIVSEAPVVVDVDIVSEAPIADAEIVSEAPVAAIEIVNEPSLDVTVISEHVENIEVSENDDSTKNIEIEDLVETIENTHVNTDS